MLHLQHGCNDESIDVEPSLTCPVTPCQVCHEAAMGPIRELGPAALLAVKAEDVRALEEKVTTQSVYLSLFPHKCLLTAVKWSICGSISSKSFVLFHSNFPSILLL
jgi:hypothetical protein